MEKLHEPKILDLTKASRGIWLVKVPKHISDNWANATPGSEIGKLKFGGKSTKDAIFSSNNVGTDKHLPTDHQFNIVKNSRDMNMFILSEELMPADLSDPNSQLIPVGKAAIEGKVVHKCECKPCISEAYINMNRRRIIVSNTPLRKVVQLERAMVSYKPKVNHANNVEYETRKKEEGKNLRLDKERVTDILFAAFAKHQFYSLQDLIKLTKQPVTYLKEILRDICTYNMKAPNKNTWQLKLEYRHYKQN